MGKSGRAILQALIDAENDPDTLLGLLERGIKTPRERIYAALQGRVTERHRFLLRLHLRQIETLEAAIAEIDAEVERDLAPFRQAVRLLQSIPGISDLSAPVILSEIGTDMSRFPTAGHLIDAWLAKSPSWSSIASSPHQRRHRFLFSRA